MKISLFFLNLFLLVPLASPAADVAGPLHPAVSIKLFNKFKEIYEPVIRSAGGILIMDVDTTRDSTGGSANRDIESKYMIILDLGIFSTPRATPDALVLTTCHELGHLMGGTPLRPPPMEWTGPTDPVSGNTLLSAEGQADYYATAACFRKIIQGENHQAVLKTKKIAPEVLQACDKAWGAGSKDSLICQRAAVASVEFLNLTKDFPISFSQPDTSITKETIVGGYPNRQCRLDTLLAGALCKQESPLDFQRQNKAACKSGLGARPACWYKN